MKHFFFNSNPSEISLRNNINYDKLSKINTTINKQHVNRLDPTTKKEVINKFSLVKQLQNKF